MASNLHARITATDKASPVLRGVKGALGALGAAAAVVGATMLGQKLVSGIKSSIEAAGEQELAMVKVARAMKLAGQNVAEQLPILAKQASALQDLTGVGDELILSAQSQLVAMGKLSGDGLERATKAALDLAAANGISVKSAFDLVAKASVGYTSTLSRYGIILDESIPKSEKFAAALSKIEEMAGGQAAAQLNTFAGRVQELQGRIGDLSEAIGGPLRDILKHVFEVVLSPVVKNITTAMETSGSWRKAILRLAIAALTLAHGLEVSGRAVFGWTTEAIKFWKNTDTIQIALNFWSEKLGAVSSAAAQTDSTTGKLIATLREMLATADEGTTSSIIDMIAGTPDQREKAKTDLDEMVEKVTVIATRQIEQIEAIDLALEHGINALKFQVEAGLLSVRSLAKTISLTVKGTMVNAAMSLGDSLVDAAFEGKMAFKEFFKQLLKDIAKAIVQALILRAILGGLGFGKGGIVPSGPLDGAPFAGPLQGPGFSRGGILHAQQGLMIGGKHIGRDATPIVARQGEAVLPRDLTERLLATTDGGAETHVFVEMGPNMAQLADSLSIEVERGTARLVTTELATSRTLK